MAQSAEQQATEAETSSSAPDTPAQLGPWENVIS